MNLKSDILKLSIIFMLILVFIPVATAMDSNDTFYIEYDTSDYEDVVDEEISHPVEDTQDHESSHEEAVETSDTFNGDISENHEEISQSNNIEENEIEISKSECNHNQEISIPELNEDDIDISDDIEVIESKLVYDTVMDDIDDLAENINETVEDELTYEENSVNQDLISKHDIKINFLLIDVYYDEISNFSTSFNHDNDFMTKMFELKEKLLLKEDIQTYFDNQAKHDCEEIVCINKITSDYAYYIDNSIVGAESIVTFVSCFSNFKSYFSTIFSGFLVIIF